MMNNEKEMNLECEIFVPSLAYAKINLKAPNMFDGEIYEMSSSSEGENDDTFFTK